MMLSISPLMTIIAIVILPISVGLVSFVVKKSQSYFKTQQEYLGHINGQIEETYGGHMVVKSFNKEKDMVDTFDKTNAVLYSSAWKSQFFSGMMQPIMMFVGNLVMQVLHFQVVCLLSMELSQLVIFRHLYSMLRTSHSQ